MRGLSKLALCLVAALAAGCNNVAFFPLPAGSGGPPTTSALAPGGATDVLVVQQPSGGGNAILRFAANSSGSVVPVSTLTVAGVTVNSVALDSAGLVYVGATPISGFGQVMVYAAGASGAATPLRTILATVNSFIQPTSLAVDAAGNLYVADQVGSSIAVYGAGANGALAPTRLIKGSLTQINRLLNLTADANGTVYASSVTGALNGTILIFPATANGNVAPARVITAPVNHFFWGVALDDKGNLFAMEDVQGFASPATIAQFAPDASGGAIPLKTITGYAGGLLVGSGLRLDGVGNVYAVNGSQAGAAATYFVEAFGPGAAGNGLPAAKFSSTSWNAAGAELGLQ